MVQLVAFINEFVGAVTSIAFEAETESVQLSVVAEEYGAAIGRTDLHDVRVLLIEEPREIDQFLRSINVVTRLEKPPAVDATPSEHSTIPLQCERKSIASGHLFHFVEAFDDGWLLGRKDGFAQAQTVAIDVGCVQENRIPRTNRTPRHHGAVLQRHEIVIVATAEVSHPQLAEVLDGFGLSAEGAVARQLAIGVGAISVQHSAFYE